MLTLYILNSLVARTWPLVLAEEGICASIFDFEIVLFEMIGGVPFRNPMGVGYGASKTHKRRRCRSFRPVLKK
jgi:hypothetical protein